MATGKVSPKFLMIPTLTSIYFHFSYSHFSFKQIIFLLQYKTGTIWDEKIPHCKYPVFPKLHFLSTFCQRQYITLAQRKSLTCILHSFSCSVFEGSAGIGQEHYSPRRRNQVNQCQGQVQRGSEAQEPQLQVGSQPREPLMRGISCAFVVGTVEPWPVQ